MQKKKTYVRDGRAPIPKHEKTSRIMSAIKGTNTKPELIIRKALRNNNVRDFALHCKELPGKPDICFSKSKLAVFINGCFWHRCPYCKPHSPKTHKAYWTNKFTKNVERDKKSKRKLNYLEWHYITIWECQIKKSLNKCIERIEKKLYLLKT